MAAEKGNPMKTHDTPGTPRRRGALGIPLGAIGLLALFLSTAFAHSVVSEYFTCRVCGHTFIDFVSVSGSSFGMRLDFQRTGALPQPWPVQQCPQCNFIISYDKEKPGGGEYTEEEFADLLLYVLSDEYQSLPPETPTYGHVVKIAEHAGGVSDFSMANLYRAAFWQTEFRRDGENPLTEGYLRKMLAFFDKCARADNPAFDERLLSYYMKVEANRRLGRFDAAEECRKEVLLLLEAIDGDGLDEESKGLFTTIGLFAEQQKEPIANRDDGAIKAVFPE